MFSLSLSLSEGFPQDRSFVEVLEGRGLHRRVWELRELAEVSDPATGESSEEERISRVIEVGDFLCYPDGAGGWVPSEPRWVGTGDSFVSSGVGYRAVAPGETGRPILYYPAWDEVEVVLHPAGLYAAQGDSEELLRPVALGVAGKLSPEDPRVILYRDALGEGVDLELVLAASGIHQNVIFRVKPELPAGYSAEKPEPAPPEEYVDGSARYVLRTELNLDALLAGGERSVVAGGEALSLEGAGRLSEDVEEEIFFTREGAETVWSFAPSAILLGSRSGREVAVAAKSFERSGETGKTYLREALPAWAVEEFGGGGSPWVWDYQTKQGTISSDTVWRGGETYWVKDLTVTNATLTIESGATVKREPGTTFAIGTGGKLIAVGEPHAMIAFTTADDTYCGEPVSGGQGDPTTLVTLQSGSSSATAIRYCKFRGGSWAPLYAYVAPGTELRDNVFVVKSGGYVAVNVSLSSYAQLSITNNVFVLAAGTPYYAVYVGNSNPFYYTDVRFSNNTFVGFPIGISLSGLYQVTIRENIFYDVTTPVSGGGSHETLILRNAYRPNADGRDSSPVILTGSPFASCALGDYFLNFDSEGQKCRYTGMRTASAAGLGGSEYTVNLPGSLFPTSQTVSSHTVYKDPLYDAPGSEAVCLGYHSPRADGLIGSASADATLTVTGPLTLVPGAVLAFRGSSGVKLTGQSPSLTSVGDPGGDGGWNTVLDKRAASTVVGLRIESPRSRYWSGGSIYFQDCQSASAEVRYTRFLFGDKLGNFGISGFTLAARDCRFEYAYWGLYAWGPGALEAQNCLFRDCARGISALNSSSAAASLCTFDRNGQGIAGSGESPIVVRDSLFSGDPLRPSYGIDVASSGTIDESFCAFSGLTANKRVGWADVPLDERSFALPSGLSPYARDDPDESCFAIRCRQFDNPPGSEILLEDAGSDEAQEGGYELGMRSATLKPGVRVLRDVGTVDIGYHAPAFDADADGMADLWEAHYDVSGAQGDADGDGAANLAEYEQASRPVAVDTDGDAWYGEGNWYGRDYKDEGPPDDPRGDGNQSWGFVSGPVGYDPRRPPYLQNMEVSGTPATCAVTIYWGHDVRQTGEETWLDGTSTDVLWVRKAGDTTFAYYAGEDAPDPQPENLPEYEKLKFRRHRLEGLACGTLYFYKIEFRHDGGSSPGTFTPVYTFRTWPAEAGDFQFAVYGDTRYRTGERKYCLNHQQVCDGILADSAFESLGFLVHVGDFVHDGWDVTDWNPHFFWPAAKVLRRLPLVTVAGNHEYNGDDDISNFRAFFDRPGEPGDYHEWDYSFALGEAEFFVIDTRQCTGDSPGPTTSPGGSVPWLRDALEAATSKWRLVFFHHPGYVHASGYGFTGTEPSKIRNLLYDRTDDVPPQEARIFLDDPALGVTAVFVGHKHLYEHALVGGDLPEGNPLEPLHQLVLGGGGAPLSAGAGAPEMQYRSGAWSRGGRADQCKAYNYCVVSVG
ncbi:MAG: right-handed parallel beta-helix repeat-containing protein, partial [Planctomycetota bacterium]